MKGEYKEEDTVWFFDLLDLGDSNTLPAYTFKMNIENEREVCLFAFPRDALFNSQEPSYGVKNKRIPSKEFKQALALILSNPNKEHDITELTYGMEQHEHHFLEVIVNMANKNPDKLPKEVLTFINEVLDEQYSFSFEEEEIATGLGDLQDHLNDLANGKMV